MKLCKKDIIMISLVLLFFVLHILTVEYETSYIKRREAYGNERWKQVESRIIELEEKIKLLEED